MTHPADQHPSPPLRINILGMEQRARNTLEVFFQNLCQSRYLLGDDSQADISIIDMDAAHADRIYREHRDRYPDRPALLLSLMEIRPERDNELFLPKPIQPEQLLASLERLQKETLGGAAQPEEPLPEQLEPSGESDAVADPERPATLPPVLDMVVTTPPSESQAPSADEPATAEPTGRRGEIVPLFPTAGPMQEMERPDDREKQKSSFIYIPENYLQGYIQEGWRIARRDNCNVSLKGPWRPIVLLPESGKIWVEQSHAHLYALSNMAIRAEDVTVTCLDSGWSPPEEGGSLLPIDQFLWKLAIRTARGRIPAGTDLRAPVYLHHWPNLSRLLPIQHGLRIAALWTRHPVSLMEAGTVLNIPAKYLFSFYSAARAIGLIGHQARDEGSPEPAPPPLPQQHEHQGLFRKILSRLRGRGR